MNWISVFDNLPENEEDVLICCKFQDLGSFASVGFYDTYKNKWYTDLPNESFEITHWAKLPELPEN